MNREEPAGDKYRDWDAAYVLGSLVPQERHEFELHLGACADCSASVAELAGVPGILAALPAYEALTLTGTAGPDLQPDLDQTVVPRTELPGTVLSGFAAKVRRRRLRNAALAAALAVGSAAAAAGITVAVAVANPAPQVQNQEAGSALKFTAVSPSPITAVGTIRGVDWGTQLDWTCTYGGSLPGAVYPDPADIPGAPTPPAGAAGQAVPGSGNATDPSSKPYLLVVTDTAGRETVAASWTAEPGSVVSPTATVGIPLNRIRSVEIRWANTGQTALRADLPGVS